MKRFTIAVFGLTGCILGPACHAIVGIEDRVEALPGDDAATGSDATPTDGGGTDAAPACPPGASNCMDPDAAPPAGCRLGCLPPAPAGWTGPSATYDGAESGKPADCAEPYTQKEIEAHVGMTAAPATCDCGTAVVTGRACTASVVTYVKDNCLGLGVKEGNVSTSACRTTTGNTGITYKVTAPTLVPGTCTFPNAKTTLPPPTFAKVGTACGLREVTACDGRADCVVTPTPAQPYGRVCIHKDGDVPCPSQDYAQRFVAHKSIDDARTCTTCTATPTGGSCGTSWGNRASATMCVALPSPSDKTADTCYGYDGSGTVVDIGAMGPSSATCSPSGGTPSGAATSTEPVTFCCSN